jgi:hypothetical protein
LSECTYVTFSISLIAARIQHLTGEPVKSVLKAI